MSTRRASATFLLDHLAFAAMTVAGISLVIMSLVQAWQVFARYVLNNSPGWTEPVALLLMSLAVMCGAAVGVRRETHFAFTGFVTAAPPMGQRILKAFSRLIAVLAGLGLMLLGGRLMLDDWAINLAGAPLPSGLRFLALALGGALILIFALERLITGDFVSTPVED